MSPISIAQRYLNREAAMLNELYEYAQRNGIASPPGFKKKIVKLYISLSKDGEFLGIVNGGEEAVLLPDIGSAAQGTESCNILAEKLSVVLCLPEVNGGVKRSTARKHEFFVDALESGGEYEPDFLIAAKALRDEELTARIAGEARAQKVKTGDIIGFAVDGRHIEDSGAYIDWWNEFRRQFIKDAPDEKVCIITGVNTPPMTTVPKISGLISVGGHTSGDSLICFDKDAFCSYGLKKANNAVVSEEAMSAVNGALGQLLETAPRLCGAKFVHWYQKRLADKDIIEFLIPDVPRAAKSEDIGGDSSDESERESEEEADKARDLQKANELINSLRSGNRPKKLENRYYILQLSGAGGRVMVRDWEEGDYAELYDNVLQWYDDLELHNSFGFWEPKTLSQYYFRLLRPMKNNTKLAERMKDELAAIHPQVVDAIIHNSPLPDAVAVKTLYYIKSKMLVSDSDDSKSKKAPVPEQTACSLLKVWLNRKYRYENNGEDRIMTEGLNANNPEQAYQLGRMMAVYAKLQNEANKNINASVVERYYASACTKPALVFGKLAQLSAYHLSKLEPKAATGYKKQLAEISTKISPDIPLSFTLKQQAAFAIGYYQQNAAMYTKKTTNTTQPDDTNTIEINDTEE